MEKNNLVKYAVIALFIGLLFYVGSLNKKVVNLEKNLQEVGTSVTNLTKGGTTAGNGQQAEPTVSLDNVKKAFDSAIIKFGDTNRKVIALEISDPSCPYCHIAGGKNGKLNIQMAQFKLVADGGTYVAPVVELKKLLDQGKISFALIYQNGHGNGELAMKALYCAYDQGKFWEANDLLMSADGYSLINEQVKNDKTKTDVLVNFLASALDKTALKTCLDSGKYDSRLSQDKSIAQGLGVSGTPGFFINTTKFAGAYGFDQMSPVVEAALK